MVQIHEEGGIYGGKREWNMPGFTRDQVKEIVPEMIIPEEQEKLIDDKGWWKQEHQETVDEVVARARESIACFKQMAKGECKGLTIFAVSHAWFLSELVYALLGQNDETIKQNHSYAPHNNGLTIIDFDLYEGNDSVRVQPKLVAHNL